MLKGFIYLYEGKKGESRTKITQAKYKTNIKKVDFSLPIFVIILNTNGLSPSNKKQKCSILIKTKKQILTYSTKAQACEL